MEKHHINLSHHLNGRFVLFFVLCIVFFMSWMIKFSKHIQICYAVTVKWKTIIYLCRWSLWNVIIVCMPWMKTPSTHTYASLLFNKWVYFELNQFAQPNTASSSQLVHSVVHLEGVNATIYYGYELRMNVTMQKHTKI